MDDQRVELAIPGKQTQVEPGEPRELAERRTPIALPGRRTLVDRMAPARLDFEDYRAFALSDVLQRLGHDHALHDDVLAAADRTVARRVLPEAAAATPDTDIAGGRAIWHAAERHAVTLYRRAADAGDVDGRDPAIAAALEQRGSGQSLPAELCRELESELGISLARVVVHTDAIAAQAARAVHADAFTVGEDIFFAENAFAPETAAGRTLLVHELAHVAQSLQGRAESPRNGVQLSRPGDSLEREAEELAERVERNLGRRRESHSTDTATNDLFGARAYEAQLGRGVRERMEQAYGERFDDVEIHPDSAEVPTGRQAFTRGRHIHLERGAFELESEHGEHVIAHELAHVAQQSRSPSGHRAASRAALEADAHQAAESVLAGRSATVQLAAPADAVLGFSNGGRPARAPANAPSSSRKGDSPAASRPPRAPARTGGGNPNTNAHSPPAPPAKSTAKSPPAVSSRASDTAAPTPAPAKGRGKDADGLHIPEPPRALTPAAAGRMQSVNAGNQNIAATVATLPTAEQQTDVARGAVVEPQVEQDGNAQGAVVADIDERPPPSPEIVRACERIRQVIKDKRPPDEDSLVDAKPREMAQVAGEEMTDGVEQRTDEVRDGYADIQQTPQGQPSKPPVPATVPPERVDTPPVDGGAGAPDKLEEEEVSLDEDVEAQKQRVEEAGMNTEPGKLVQDGPIGDARGGVDDLDTMAKTDPERVLAEQATAVGNAKGDMRALQLASEQALAQARAGTVGQIATHNTGIKGTEEQQRTAAGERMQAIFTNTQKTVDGLLAPLSNNAVARWQAGIATLSTDFENSLAHVKGRIEERHSGVDGFIVGLGDDVFGLPDWVVEAYDAAEKTFSDGATSLLTDISRDVNLVIDNCKKLIKDARADIEAIVKELPESLQAWAKGEAARLGQQFDQLDQRVDQTQRRVNQDLIQRANEAVQQVRERVHELREAAKGLLSKIADAIAEFIKDPFKAIINGLLSILGIPKASFWALIDKLGDVISGIAQEPVKFANTLIEGVGAGFRQFFDRIPMHLGKAMFEWLFSKLGEAGITMPADFSARSIVTLVLEVLGVTWPRIRMLLARHIGERNADLLDQAYELIATLMERGPQGLYELLSDQLDPAMIVDMIKEAALQFVIEAIITRVAARLLLLFNPAGAILQAIEAIFKVVKWVFENAARIFTLIESIVNGAAMMLAGNVSGVAALVEMSLARLLVMVIDFLADYIGLGGIPNAIKNVIMGLQSRVEAILNRVIGFLVTKARGLWEAMKNRGKGKDKEEDGKDTAAEFKTRGKGNEHEGEGVTPGRKRSKKKGDADDSDHAQDAKSKKNSEADGLEGEADKKEEDKKLLARAVSAIRPKLAALLAEQPTKARVQGQLAQWRARYGLTALVMDDREAQVRFVAKVNPEETVGNAIDPEGAVLFRAKQKAQKEVLNEIEKDGSSADLADEFKFRQKQGRPLELPTAEDQVRFAGVLKQGNAGTGQVLIGSGSSAVPTSFTQLEARNSIFVRGLGTSQSLLDKLRAGAARLGMTEQELAVQIMNFGHTGEIDARIQRDQKLMKTIGNELFRQHSVEPVRIPTHLSDRAGALERAASQGGSISDLETPADIARVKGQTQGAVRGHATAEEMLRRSDAGEGSLRAGTIRERTGRLVLQASEAEAQKMDDRLFNDPEALERALVARIRQQILGRET